MDATLGKKFTIPMSISVSESVPGGCGATITSDKSFDYGNVLI